MRRLRRRHFGRSGATGIRKLPSPPPPMGPQASVPAPLDLSPDSMADWFRRLAARGVERRSGRLTLEAAVKAKQGKPG